MPLRKVNLDKYLLGAPDVVPWQYAIVYNSNDLHSMDSSPKFRILRLSLLIFAVLMIIVGGFAAYSKKKNVSLNNTNKAKISDLVRDETLLEKTLQGMSVKEAMARLVDESEGGSAYDCHQEAHNIGRMGYKIYKEKAFGECSASCHSGCYHGAMEKFLKRRFFEAAS